MKILVTGGTGFIGQHLVCALVKKGHQVKVIARDPEKAKLVEKIGAKVVFGDLEDKEFLRKELKEIEVVYHLAAIPRQAWCYTKEEYHKVNVGYTKNLLASAGLNKIKRFIYCSSIQSTMPSTFYGESKLKAEKAVLASGLAYVIVRPGIVYGRGDRGGLGQLFKQIRRGFFPLPNAGKNRLAIIYIDDLVNLFLKCLDVKCANKIITAVGEKIEFRTLVDISSRAINKSYRQISLPVWFLNLAAMPLEYLAQITKTKPIFDREQIKFLSFDYKIRIPAWQKKFWQAKVKYEEGIRRTVGWYK